jgi:hypothetical protein
MAIKFEVIIYANDEEKTVGATTTIFTCKQGYTQKELDVARHIKDHVDNIFKNEFKSIQINVINKEENNNVH